MCRVDSDVTLEIALFGSWDAGDLSMVVATKLCDDIAVLSARVRFRSRHVQTQHGCNILPGREPDEG